MLPMNTMKRIFTYLGLSLLVVFVGACSLNKTQTYHTAHAETDSNIVIALSGEIKENKIIIDAVMMKNDGINGLTVELSYNNNVMTLSNINKGSALTSLDFLTTNTDTDKGYSILPFKINWSGDENDKSTGKLFSMEFLAKDNKEDGVYPITLITERGKSATYIDGKDTKTRNVLVGGVQVEVKGNVLQPNVEKIPNPDIDNENNNIVLLVSLISGGAVLIIGGAALTFILLRRKGKKTWTKVK